MFSQRFGLGHRRHLAAAVAAAAVIGAMLLPAGAPTSAAPLPAHQLTAASTTSRSAHPPRGRVAWRACRAGFQCATVQVPLDYAAPTGARISLSVVRLPAADRSRRIGSLMMNPGGPGGSGVDLVRGVAQFLPLELRARFDIVGFDPRGDARSTPVRCFGTLDQALKVLPLFAFPVTAAEERAQHRYVDKLGAACARHAGPILAHASTADVARDMDQLRTAMGDRKTNYFGWSYGSFLGQVYANLFPGKIRALAIDGVVDPRAWVGRGAAGKTVPIGARLRSDVGAMKTLSEFFRLCDQSGTGGCALAGHSGQRYRALAAKLRAHPLESPDLGKFTYADLVAITLGALYAPFTWPDAAALFADLERAAKPALLQRDLATLRRKLGLGAKAQEQYPNFVEASPAVACSDSRNPAAFAAWPRAAAATEHQHGYFGRPWTWSWSECAAWPKTAGADRYVGPWTARTAAPVLVVGNYFDPATRYGGAVAAAHLLRRSRLLTYAGWGHTAFLGGNYCIDQAVTRYLVNVRTPAVGTVCRPQGSPFGPEQLAAGGAAAVITAATLPGPVRRALTRR
jgi:pimeloyl-ACP methyl ester carboxylesterase